MVDLTYRWTHRINDQRVLLLEVNIHLLVKEGTECWACNLRPIEILSLAISPAIYIGVQLHIRTPLKDGVSNSEGWFKFGPAEPDEQDPFASIRPSVEQQRWWIIIANKCRVNWLIENLHRWICYQNVVQNESDHDLASSTQHHQ